MERLPQDSEDRLARLEGQYHTLSKELTDKFKDLKDTLTKVQQQVEEIHTVKTGMLKSENLSDVVLRIDQQLDAMQKQIVVISNNVQIK